MKSIVFYLALCASLYSCKIVGLTVGYGMMHAQEKAASRKLNRINQQFDIDGWYTFEHNADPELLYATICAKDSSELDIFYSHDEYHFLRENAKVSGTSRDTFECSVPSRFRYSCDFSPSRDHFKLNSTEPRQDIETGLHCYMKITPDTVACILITAHKISIPYLLITSKTTIALPKRYIPNTDFKTYSESLIDFDSDFYSSSKIRINGHHKIQLDTSERFRNFIEYHPFEPEFTQSSATIDTSKYDLNHKIQFYCNANAGDLTYRRHFLRYYNSVDYRSRSQRETDVTYCYLAPLAKKALKKRLDRLFDELIRSNQVPQQ